MDYVEEFLDFCRYQRSLSENTLYNYKLDLQQYFEWLQDRRLELTEIKIKDIDSFIISQRKKGKKIKTINRKLYALKSFYRYLQRIEFLDRNPLDFFKNIREPKYLPKYLTMEEQQALIEASGNGNHKGQRCDWMRQRDHLMILFFLDCGLRVSEVCNIELSNLNLEEGTLRILGKGDKEREVILSDRLIQGIGEYLPLIGDFQSNGSLGPGLPARGTSLKALAEQMGFSVTAVMNALFFGASKRLREIRAFVDKNIEPLPIKFFFFNQQGKPMNTRHVFRIIREIGNRAGIKDLYCHLLRHTYATNLRRKGADLLLIKEALGHSSVSTTEIYAHIGGQEYKKKIRSLINC